jgi:hypothetical protein
MTIFAFNAAVRPNLGCIKSEKLKKFLFFFNFSYYISFDRFSRVEFIYGHNAGALSLISTFYQPSVITGKAVRILVDG